MPTYCYETPGGAVVERVFPIGKAPRVIQVGRVSARRSFSAERASIPPAKGWPLTCFASGVNAAQAGQLREFLNRKGVPTEVTRDGDPIYRNAQHRRKALKARGLFDRSSFI
jgi:hypothetical protein